MRERYEPGFELGGWDPHPALDELAEEAAEARRVAGRRVVVIAHGRYPEEQSQHRAYPLDAAGPRTEGFAQSFLQIGGRLFELAVRILAFEEIEGRHACRNGHGVPGQGPGLVDRALGADLRHEVGPAAVRGQRQATSDHLAESREVGADGRQALVPRATYTKARHDFVEDQQRAARRRNVAQAFQKTFVRWNHSHVTGDGLDDDGRDVAIAHALHGFEIVVTGDACESDYTRRHARTVRHS